MSERKCEFSWPSFFMFGMLSIFPHIYWRWVEKEYIALFILLNHALLMAKKKK